MNTEALGSFPVWFSGTQEHLEHRCTAINSNSQGLVQFVPKFVVFSVG